MGMSQLKNRVLRYLLILMIILSLYLSFKIWVKPASRVALERNETVSDILHTKVITDVYLPTKLFYHKPNEASYLYTNKESTIASVQKKLVLFDFETARVVEIEKAQKVLNNDNVFNLVYPSNLPISLFLEINQLPIVLPENEADKQFNRITVSLEDKLLYFTGSEQDSAIEVPIDGDFDGLLHDLNAKNTIYYPVELSHDNVSNIYYLKENTKLKIYSYIVATQSFTTFSKGFFNESTDLYSNNGEDLNLSNSEGESLTISSDTGEVTYFGKLKGTYTGQNNSLYYNTFEYVEGMGTSLGNMRYFSSSKDEVIYRNYVEGFPVFGPDMKGSLKTTVQRKNVYIKANQETLQVPIPSDETVELIPTSELVDNLISMGAKVEDVTDIQIGYSWRANMETKQAVDLVPEWYLRYKGSWITQSDLEKALNKGGDA